MSSVSMPHPCAHTKAEAVVSPCLHAVPLHDVRRLPWGEHGGEERQRLERRQERGTKDGVSNEF
jgi:hypothetical protein